MPISFWVSLKITGFLFLFFFSFSWNWYSNGSTANGKKISLPFLQAWGSWNHSKMQPFFKHESILYTFRNHYKEVNFRSISNKSSVLTIFQFKEVLFLRFKLLAFLSLVAQAIFPLRQHSTPKKQGVLAAKREAHWKLILFSWYIRSKRNRTKLQK